MAKPLDSVTMFRPRSYDKAHPGYCPDRDIAMIGSSLIQDLAMAFAAGRFKGWYPLLWELLQYQKSSQTVDQSIDSAGQRLGAFYRAALARDKNEQGEKPTVAEQKEYLAEDFKSAMQTFNDADPAGSFFVASMMGYMLMDYMFFAVRQSQLLGEEHHRYVSEFVSMVHRLSNGWRLGETDFKLVEREVESLVSLLMTAGYTGSQISKMVDKAVVECLSSQTN